MHILDLLDQVAGADRPKTKGTIEVRTCEQILLEAHVDVEA